MKHLKIEIILLKIKKLWNDMAYNEKILLQAASSFLLMLDLAHTELLTL
jgi:hypothetical protein